MSSFFRKLGWLSARRRKEDELCAELQFHLEEEAEEIQAGGAVDEDARMQARRELGNITLVSESTRAAWSWTWLEQFLQDIRYTLRTMLSNKAFTALAALSLALGIGANTAIFSFMDAIMLRLLPVADPKSLVVLNWHAPPSRHGETVMVSMSGSSFEENGQEAAGIFPYPAFELFEKNDSIFSSVFAFVSPWENVTVALNGGAALGSIEYVSGNYFRGLGVPPAAGRLIISDDDREGADNVAVLSFAFSQNHFGNAAGAAGRSILINNKPFTVVGIAPPGFYGVDPAAVPDVFLPMHANIVMGRGEPFGFQAAGYQNQNYYWVQVMGRLRPGVSRAQAQASLAPPFHNWVANTATNDVQRASLPVLSVKEGAGGLDSLQRQFSKPLNMLLGLVGLILAIACANVANLLLARAASRRREIALRLSLGAGRPRVVRQLLTESVLLASLGGALGILFAIWGIRLLTFLLGNGQRHITVPAELNWHVLCAAAALSILTGLLFGLAPALQATRVDVVPALKETRAGRSGPRRFWRIGTTEVLMTGQIAISVLMLVAAGLFVRTLSNLQSIELGFNRENVLLFQLNARQAGHKDPEISTVYDNLRKRFAAIPGVRSATLSDSSLIGAGSGLPIFVPGKKPSRDNRFLTVGPGFFFTMQVPIVAGREIDEHDRPGSTAVAIVNEVFAKDNFGDTNPLGRHLILRNMEQQVGRDMVIVGVAKNARYGGIREKIPPVIYMPYDQGYPPPREMVYALRTAGDPLAYVKQIREIVHQEDPHLPVSDVKTQAAEINETINEEITLAELCTALAMLALVIACVGLYGVVSYNVSRRTGEIGIRMALGARRGVVVWMVLRQVLLLAVVGLGIGVPLALAASRLVEAFLFGTKPNDPVSLALAAAILLCAGLLAGYIPARRAARIDPMAALRHE